MARSLARNTRLVVSTLSPANLTPANATTSNTFEVKVLDGYTFSQDVTSQEVGVNEAGTAPVRGTLGFNTALNPVDVSFSTYVRAYDDSGTANCVERPLWASAMGTDLVVGAGHAIEVADATHIQFGLSDSNNNQLLALYLYFILENTTYVIQDFNVATAEVDFSIDGIATINWSGFGSRVNENLDAHNRFTDTGDTNYLTEGTDYKGVPATTTTTFLRNKLSTLDLKDNVTGTPTIDNNNIAAGGITGTNVINLTATTIPSTLVGGRVHNTTQDEYATIIAVDDGANTVTVAENVSATGLNWVATNVLDYYAADVHAGVVYSIPITGATLTLENNFTYLTPEELAIVNLPLAGFAGNRVISGSFTAYLNTGATGSGGLLAELLTKIEEVSNNFELVFHMGGGIAQTPRVDFTIAHAQIAVPTTNVEDIISTEISFTGKPWDTGNNVGSFEDTNELVISYLP